MTSSWSDRVTLVGAWDQARAFLDPSKSGHRSRARRPSSRCGLDAVVPRPRVRHVVAVEVVEAHRTPLTHCLAVARPLARLGRKRGASWDTTANRDLAPHRRRHPAAGASPRGRLRTLARPSRSYPYRPSSPGRPRTLGRWRRDDAEPSVRRRDVRPDLRRRQPSRASHRLHAESDVDNDPPRSWRAEAARSHPS
jgi:hypothetical protein